MFMTAPLFPLAHGFIYHHLAVINIILLEQKVAAP
jgi:hypothetical protein